MDKIILDKFLKYWNYDEQGYVLNERQIENKVRFASLSE